MSDSNFASSPHFPATATPNTRCCICGGGDTVNYDNNVANGVMDLQLNLNAVGSINYDIEDAAVEELKRLFYVDSLNEKFDNVMLCIPEGTYSSASSTRTDWVAYAALGGETSVYNGDRWCANEVTQLHEIGHNWGLQ